MAWDFRKMQASFMYGQMDEAERTSAELRRIYAKAADELRESMGKVFSRYEDLSGLTQQDAVELVARLAGKTDIQSIKQAAEALPAGPKKDAFLAQLETPAFATKLQKLQDLQERVTRQVKALQSYERQTTRRHYARTAEDSYYRTIYGIQQKVGFQFEFPRFDEKAARKMLASRWDGEGWDKRLATHGQAMVDDVKDQIMLELVSGKKLETAAREISERYGVHASNARRLVRTVSNFCANQAQLDAYRECGVDEYEFVATLDTVTCPVCGAIDRHRFKVKDAMPGENCPPMHPYCRCTTIMPIDEKTVERLERRARDPETGRNGKVPAATTYRKWRKDNDL